MKAKLMSILVIAVLGATAYGSSTPVAVGQSEQHPNQVLEWNQVFVDTLIATSTAIRRSSGSERSFTGPSSMP